MDRLILRGILLLLKRHTVITAKDHAEYHLEVDDFTDYVNNYMESQNIPKQTW